MQRMEAQRLNQYEIRRNSMQNIAIQQGKQMNENMVIKRKLSCGSIIKDYDIEKLIKEIKIKPNKSINQECIYIDEILKMIAIIQANHLIADEVHTIKLLLETMKKKLLSNNLSYGRNRNSKFKESDLKEIIQESALKDIRHISPIQQLDNDNTSRILYTNFSIKDMEANQNHISSKKQLNTPQKLVISQFDQDDNDKIDQLNSQIKQLQGILREKAFTKNKIQNQSHSIPLKTPITHSHTGIKPIKPKNIFSGKNSQSTTYNSMNGGCSFKSSVLREFSRMERAKPKVYRN